MWWRCVPSKKEHQLGWCSGHDKGGLGQDDQRHLLPLLLLGLLGNRTASRCTSPIISLCIYKGGGWRSSQESLDCLWLQYRFYTAPRKRELHLKLQRCLSNLSAAGVICVAVWLDGTPGSWRLRMGLRGHRWPTVCRVSLIKQWARWGQHVKSNNAEEAEREMHSKGTSLSVLKCKSAFYCSHFSNCNNKESNLRQIVQQWKLLQYCCVFLKNLFIRTYGGVLAGVLPPSLKVLGFL